MGDKHGTLLTSEEAALLGEEIKPPPSPGSSPEPAKWNTTPSISSLFPVPQSDCHPSSKANESWKGVKADINHPNRWVFSYLKENDRVPEWWREFWSLIPSLNESFGDIPVQRMAHQQAIAFRLPAAQVEWEGSWTVPSCVGSLGWRDFPPPKDFKGAQDYWVVWAEEKVAVAKALHRCTVHSGNLFKFI